MADTTNDTRPVDREYLNLRLSELQARIDAKLAGVDSQFAQLETRLTRQFLGMFVPLLVAVLGTLVAVLVK